MTAVPGGLPQKILAIDQRRVDVASHAAPSLVTPISVAPNALADGVPSATLQLPAESLILVPDPRDAAASPVLVPIGALVNGRSIHRGPASGVTNWFTLQLAGHSAIFASDLPVGTTRMLPAAKAAKPRRTRVPVQDGPVQDGPVQDGPVQGGPVQGGPVQGGPVQGGTNPEPAAPVGSVAPLCARLLPPGATLSDLRARLASRRPPDTATPDTATPAATPRTKPAHGIAPSASENGFGPVIRPTTHIKTATPFHGDADVVRPRKIAAAGAAQQAQPMAQLIVTTSAQEQPSATADRDRPPLHIVSAGRAISARAYAADGWFTFELPAGPGPVQLTTPSGRAATSADPRKLGLPILAIELDGAAIALDAPELGGGFHPSEGDGTTISWRWTDGAASLILPKRMVTVTLRVRVALWYNSIIR